MLARVQLKENEQNQFVSAEFGKILRQHQVCSVELTASGEFKVGNVSKVGFIRQGGAAIEIRPKVPVRQLLQLLNPDLREAAFFDEWVPLAESDDWTDALVEFFCRSLEIAMMRGPLEGYQTKSRSSEVLKGRIDFSAQLKRNAGQYFPMEVTYDDFVTDIAENQIIRTAIQILLSKFPLQEATRKQLLIFDGYFDGVSTFRFWEEAPRYELDRRNAHLEVPLKIAELIVLGRALDGIEGESNANTFLIDMARLFERFLGSAFQRLSNGSEFTFLPQGAGDSLDQDGIIKFKPDFLWKRGQQISAIADAKYKRIESQSQVPNEDLYQVLSYCGRYGLNVGYIIYAEAPSFSLHMEGSQTEIRIRSVDLSQKITSLQVELGDLHDEILYVSG